MIGKKKTSSGSDHGRTSCDTVVGIGSQMKGEITCKGPSRIAGHVEGELVGDDRILISKEAHVDGKISAVEVEIDGKVDGTISATTLIILNETAVVTGDLTCNSIVIEEGAVFNGTSTMPEGKSKPTLVEAPNVHALETKNDTGTSAKVKVV